MAKRKPKRRVADELARPVELQIIGGKHRGRKLAYEPFRRGDDPVTRPMKHRVREAIFNLVGVAAEGRHAIDLFAGTGALGLEALSRGAARATFIERHVPTARVIEENMKSLGVEGQSTLLVTSAFLWGKRDIAGIQSTQRGVGNEGESASRTAADGSPSVQHSAFSLQPFPLPWLVFCSPPYDFFIERQPEMFELLTAVMQHAPSGSIIVVESDERFDVQLLPNAVEHGGAAEWDVRTYAPAVVSVWRRE